MNIPTSSSWRRDLQTIFGAGTLAGQSDVQLLERIVTLRRDGREADTEVESAFALLVERHGPMVQRVCRGVLRDSHEADDAFQATFLVLLRQAGTIRKRGSVGPWLHGVAHRVAACARSAAARRRAHERRWFERRQAAVLTADDHDHDLSITLHAELDRLPERYRAPIILCDLEEQSLDEAARQLGWPLGTVKSRLNRGRQQLRDRLIRRGVAPGLAALALRDSGLTRAAATGVSFSPVTPEDVIRTLATAGTTGKGLSTQVIVLARGVCRTMWIAEMKTSAGGLFAGGLTALALGAVANGPGQIAPGDSPSQVQASKTVPESVKIDTQKHEAQPPPAKTANRAADDSRLETIDISGRTTDTTGRPVVGATVYVIDANRRTWAGAKAILGTATTGIDGRFSAAGVKLPVWKPDRSPLPTTAEEGRFQVAAAAPGFGFGWHEIMSYRPAERSPSAQNKPDVRNDEAIFRGEPIDVKLALGPAASIRGKIVDDRGRPLAGVKVQLGVCDDPRRPGTGITWSCARVDPTDSVPRDRRTFDGIRALPESLVSTRTGPDGSYRIDGLPRETEFLTMIDPGPDYDFRSDTAATTSMALADVQCLGYDGVLDHAFESPREVRLTVWTSDHGLPARGATVRARSNREMLRAGSVGVTDDNGHTALHLRPGEYDLVVEPAPGAVDRPGQRSLKLGREEAAEINDLKLEPAALVTLEAVDARTGAGIEGVRFQYETDTTRQRHELSSQLVFVDHPETDERGRLRAIVEPGRRRFFAQPVPSGWKVASAPTELGELVAGREITIRFALEKTDAPTTEPLIAAHASLFPAELTEKMRQQERLTRSGSFRVRHYFYFLGADPMPAEKLLAYLDTNDLSQTRDPVETLAAAFPSLPSASESLYNIIDDGRRRRNMLRFVVQARDNRDAVSNGLEVVNYDGINAQADVFDARHGGHIRILGASDLSDWPRLFNPRGRTSSTKDDVQRVEAGDRLIAEWNIDEFTARWVVDRKNGFMHAHSLRSKEAGHGGRVVRQYGQRSFAGGAVLPQVHVHFDVASDQIIQLFITVLEDADLEYRPTSGDFVVSVPAGTVILDHRADNSHPKQGMTRYPIPDVITFADGLTGRNRAVEPVLRSGQAAPPLRPAVWLDQKGPTKPPDLVGKVVLVDFWGIGCGPCVASLPEVQAAADHFASRSKDFVLIGLHDSGATVEQVAAFARKRALTYRLAVDGPVPDGDWFGTTFKDYGVHAIPSAAVIDRQGKVVFVGRFPEALQKIAELLGSDEKDRHRTARQQGTADAHFGP